MPVRQRHHTAAAENKSFKSHLEKYSEVGTMIPVLGWYLFSYHVLIILLYYFFSSIIAKKVTDTGLRAWSEGKMVTDTFFGNAEDAEKREVGEEREEGFEEGMEKGRFNEKLEIARNLLAKGSSLEFVHDITGLDMETLRKL